jgi:hypothetical protein
MRELQAGAECRDVGHIKKKPTLHARSYIGQSVISKGKIEKAEIHEYRCGAAVTEADPSLSISCDINKADTLACEPGYDQQNSGQNSEARHR